MWALIMTVYIIGTSADQKGFSMTTLDSFTSEQACINAGARQEVALRHDLGINTKRYTFICVKKD